MGAVRSSIALAVMCLILATGCAQQYNQSIKSVAPLYAMGQYDQAAMAARESVADARQNHQRNTLVMLLEEGEALRTCAELDPSTASFDEAYALFDKYDQQAKVKLSREAYALMTNLANCDYEGYGYDRIMINVYKSLNYLQQGKSADARIEINRIAGSQQKCEQRYLDKINRDKEEAQKLKGEKNVTIDYNKAKQDPRYAQGEQQLFSDFQDVAAEPTLDDQSHKRLYSNPYAEYLQGLFFLNSNVAGEREVGRVAMRNTAAMMENNPYLPLDVQYAEAAAGGTIRPRVYVIFETGMAPIREQIRIDIPVFLYNIAIHDTRVDYVGVAFPRLVKVGNNHPYIYADTTAGQFPTHVLADMDKIVAREFKNELPWVVTRAIISAVIKAGMQAGVAEATKHEDQIVQFLARAAVAGYAAATNEADLRTWHTLPKQVQLASFPAPADGNVGLRLPNGQQLPAVTVPADKSTLIWIRSPSISAPVVVTQIPLN